MTSDADGAECTCTMWPAPPICPRRTSVRSIDITGVTPEPAVRNSTDAGAGSGITKLPCGACRRTIVPAAMPSTRCVDRKPSGMAFTVMAMLRSPLPNVAAGAAPDREVVSYTGLDVSEYDRHRHRPSTSTPMPMYWPGS
jgi:hypothetical protein